MDEEEEDSLRRSLAPALPLLLLFLRRRSAAAMVLLDFTTLPVLNRSLARDFFESVDAMSFLTLPVFRRRSLAKGSLVVDETPPPSASSDRCFEALLVVVLPLCSMSAGPLLLQLSGCVELTGDTCCDLLVEESDIDGCCVFGLEVVLLASPFSTLLFAAVAVAEDVEVEVDVVGFTFTAVIVLTVDAGRLLDELFETAEADAVDFIVGVTVAEGLVDAGLCFVSVTSGFMGVVVVEAPANLGSGARADWTWGFTWPMAGSFREGPGLGFCCWVAIGVVVGTVTAATAPDSLLTLSLLVRDTEVALVFDTEGTAEEAAAAAADDGSTAFVVVLDEVDVVTLNGAVVTAAGVAAAAAAGADFESVDGGADAADEKGDDDRAGGMVGTCRGSADGPNADRLGDGDGDDVSVAAAATGFGTLSDSVEMVL